MAKLTTSIVLCTYNGERYLGEQLDSFAAQTRPPDELIICDDRSTDGTVAIARAFSARAPFPVRLQVNESNAGISENFGNALALAGCDVIYLSDQDDVWQPSKIQWMTDILEADAAAGFVFCNASVVDSSLKPLGYSFWDSLGFTPAAQSEFRRDPFRFLLKINVVAGATMAFRATHQKHVLPIPRIWMHDHWIALMIAALSRGVAVQEPLNLYRQHPKQELGGRKKSLWQRFREGQRADPNYYTCQHEKFQQLAYRIGQAELPRAGVREALGGKVRHAAARAAMRTLSWARAPLILRETITGRYHRFGQGWKSLLADVLT